MFSFNRYYRVKVMVITGKGVDVNCFGVEVHVHEFAVKNTGDVFDIELVLFAVYLLKP